MTLEEFIAAFGDGVLDATEAFQDLLDSYPRSGHIHLDLQGGTLRLSRPIVLPGHNVCVRNAEIMLAGELAERFRGAPSVDAGEIFLSNPAEDMETWLDWRAAGQQMERTLREKTHGVRLQEQRLLAFAALWIAVAAGAAVTFGHRSALADTIMWVILALSAREWLAIAAKVRLRSRCLAGIRGRAAKIAALLESRGKSDRP
jgi:hypothetical protein